MRLFVAIELSPEAKGVLGRRLGRLKANLPDARWVDPENVHLTLAFLGEVAEDRLASLDAALAPAFAAHAPFPMRLQGGGTFPPGRPGRVAWIGVKAPPALASLQRDVARAAAAALDESQAGRPFHGHVTVARSRRPWPRRTVERFQQEVGHGAWSDEWTVREGVLFESQLAPRGARYEARSRYSLEGS